MSVTAIGKVNFDKEVLQSELPVLVDFWAPWCPHCRKIGPAYEQIAGEYAGALEVVPCRAGAEAAFPSASCPAAAGDAACAWRRAACWSR